MERSMERHARSSDGKGLPSERQERDKIQRADAPMRFESTYVLQTTWDVTLEAQIWRKVNEYRANEQFGNDLPPLGFNHDLYQAAEAYAWYLANNYETTDLRNMFKKGSKAHYLNGSPASRAADAGYPGDSIWENLAVGVDGSRDGAAHDVVSGWIGSSGHAANMERNATHMGVGVAHGRYGWRYVLLIGD